MPSTTNDKMDSPSVSDLHPSSVGSPASMMSEEVDPSPGSEESEPTQTMALIPHTAAQSTSNAAHLEPESPTLLTSGNVYNVDIPPWIASANPIHQHQTTNTSPSSMPSTLGLSLAQQAATVGPQPTYAPLPVITPIHNHNQHTFGLASLLHTNPVAAFDSQSPQAPGTVPSGSQSTTGTHALFTSTAVHHLHQLRHHHTSFDAAAFVDTLEEVNIASIAPEDMRCPHCWLPFGTTTEDDSSILVYMDEGEQEIMWRLNASYELPFCVNRPNNDPVRTPCGHIFGKQCLVQSLEETNKTCPMCRQELGGTGGVPTGMVVASESDALPDLPSIGLF